MADLLRAFDFGFLTVLYGETKREREKERKRERERERE